MALIKRTPFRHSSSPFDMVIYVVPEVRPEQGRL